VVSERMWCPRECGVRENVGTARLSRNVSRNVENANEELRKEVPFLTLLKFPSAFQASLRIWPVTIGGKTPYNPHFFHRWRQS
jgi:hypothetical protein